MKFETQRLLLRQWREDDFSAFHQINTDPRVMELYPALNTPEQTRASMARANESMQVNGFGLFAVEEKSTRRLLGFIGLQKVPFEAHFTPAVEIGWRLAFDLWGSGLATEGARAVLEDGFTRCDLKEIIAMTVPHNVRSRRVMEKLGMIQDLAGDFAHPRILEGHVLRQHVLYRIQKGSFLTQCFQ
jgi:RimJ/RimL family protein N-acetyltransferase